MDVYDKIIVYKIRMEFIIYIKYWIDGKLIGGNFIGSFKVVWL